MCLVIEYEHALRAFYTRDSSALIHTFLALGSLTSEREIAMTMNSSGEVVGHDKLTVSLSTTGV